jgi:hypothetical protein
MNPTEYTRIDLETSDVKHPTWILSNSFQKRI